MLSLIANTASSLIYNYVHTFLLTLNEYKAPQERISLKEFLLPMQLGKPGDSSACWLQSQAEASLRGQTFLLGSGSWKGCLEAFL